MRETSALSRIDSEAGLSAAADGSVGSPTGRLSSLDMSDVLCNNAATFADNGRHAHARVADRRGDCKAGEVVLKKSWFPAVRDRAPFFRTDSFLRLRIQVTVVIVPRAAVASRPVARAG